MRFAILFLTLLRAAAASAETVAVVPFVSPDRELAIYGKPVADALAKVLSQSYQLTAVVSDASAPVAADLVVELRAIREKKKVRLEAWVRDPRASQRDSVAIEHARLAELDRAAADLAHRVGVRLLAVLEPRRRRKAERPAPPPPPAPAEQRPAVDQRPVLIVYRPSGEDTAHAQAAAHDAATELAGRLGFRAVPSKRRGLVPIELAAGDASVAGARATLMLNVTRLTLVSDGVLTATAVVRMVLVSRDTRVLIDREVATDTVVGGRGDGQAKLVQLVMRQAMDIVQREVASALRG